MNFCGSCNRGSKGSGLCGQHVKNTKIKIARNNFILQNGVFFHNLQILTEKKRWQEWQ